MLTQAHLWVRGLMTFLFRMVQSSCNNLPYNVELNTSRPSSAASERQGRPWSHQLIAGLTSRSNDSHRYSHLRSICPSQMNVCGQWEEAGEPQSEWTLHRKAPGLGLQTWDLLSIRQRPSSIWSFSPPILSHMHHGLELWHKWRQLLCMRAIEASTNEAAFSLSVGLQIVLCDLHLRRSTASKLERGRI